MTRPARLKPKPIELVVYVTDGDPTAYDFNQPGDPFDPGPPPDVAISTDRDLAAQTTLDRAVQEANRIKSSGTRMLAVGVGSAVTGNPASRSRLVQIAGPQVVDDAGLGVDHQHQSGRRRTRQELRQARQLLAWSCQRVVHAVADRSKLAQTAGSAGLCAGRELVDHCCPHRRRRARTDGSFPTRMRHSGRGAATRRIPTIRRPERASPTLPASRRSNGNRIQRTTTPRRSSRKLRKPATRPDVRPTPTGAAC